MRFKSRFQSRLKSGFTSRFTLDSGVFRFSASAAGGGYSYTNTEAATFEAAIADTTAWDDTYRGHLDQLFSDLKSGQVNGTNVLAELDMLYLHNAPDSATALTDIIDPTRTATAVNSPTFTANEGFTGNGTTSYIDTNYDAAAGPNFQQNSAMMGVWVRTADSSSTLVALAGQRTGAVTNIYASPTSSRGYSGRGPTSGTFAMDDTSLGNADISGYLAKNRSTFSAVQSYIGATQNATATSSSSSISTGLATMLVLAEDFGGAARFTDAQVSASLAGGSLTAAQHADLYDALNRYRAAREAEAVVAAFNAQAATDLTETEASHVSTLVESLVAAGVWDKLDMLYLHDLDVEANALRDLKDPTRTATAVNSPTFTANQGFTGDGSSAYIDLDYAPDTDGVNYTQNSASLFSWVRAIGGSALEVYLGAGSSVASPSEFSVIRRVALDASPWAMSINQTGLSSASTRSDAADGLLAANRDASSSNDTFRNGVLETSPDTTSSAPTSLSLYALALNFDGTTTQTTSGQVSVSGAGGSLTAAQHADLYDALNTYRTAREAV